MKTGKYGEPWTIDDDGFMWNRDGVSPTFDVYGDIPVRQRVLACVNALAGRDPAKLDGLVDAVKALLVANSCTCDVESVDDMAGGLKGENRCMEHRLQDALAAFQGGGGE